VVIHVAIRYEGNNYGEGGSNSSVSRLWEKWWQGDDPGHEISIRLTLRIPTQRTDEDFGDLLESILRSGLDGGHKWRIEVDR
jgi:hypothetical protein